jgi:hypothetical protein
VLVLTHANAQRDRVRRVLQSEEIQPRLRVSTPRDTSEVEAERVASAVMQMPDVAARDAAQAVSAESPHLQRRGCCGHDDEDVISRSKRQATPVLDEEEERKKKRRDLEKRELEKRREQQRHKDHQERRKEKDVHAALHEHREEDEPVHLKAGHRDHEQTDPDAISAVRGVLGGGQPISERVRRFFERRFGRDFGQVRVHANADADESAQAIGADAFAFRNHIAFAAGRYAPDSAPGCALLAHELAHVVQQGYAAPASTSDASPPQSETAGAAPKHKPRS